MLINFNTVNVNLKYAVAALISTTGNTKWVGTNTLISDQGAATGDDGIAETTGNYPYVTTKDSGGTGSVNWVKWKGVRTAVATVLNHWGGTVDETDSADSALESVAQELGVLPDPGRLRGNGKEDPGAAEGRGRGDGRQHRPVHG